MYICICNNLTGKDLATKAIDSKSYEDFMERTNNAGRACGKCNSYVKKIYENWKEN
jgi:bacterioferritin-associated ferredoxin